MKTIMNYLAIVLNFTTGLGFYGLGLVGVALGAWIIFGWSYIATGFIGAFIFKNYEAIIKNINKL